MRLPVLFSVSFFLFTICSNAQQPGTFNRTADGLLVYPGNAVSGKQAIHVAVISPRIIRVQAVPDGGNPVPGMITVPVQGADTGFRLTPAEGSVTLATNALDASIDLADGSIVFRDKAGNRITGETKSIPRKMTPMLYEGKTSFALTQSFDLSKDDGYYGLGQHQDEQYNYRDGQVELFQNNTEVAVPFLVSRKFGILWDNYSLTTIGDVRPLLPLSSLQLYSASGDEGWLSASYYNSTSDTGNAVLVRPESTIDMQYLGESLKQLPDVFKPAQGMVRWDGSIAAAAGGIFKMRVVYGGYLKIWINDSLVLDRWRKAWNPAPALVSLPLTAGGRSKIRIQWIPEGSESYLSVKYQQPVDPHMQNTVTFSSEAGQSIDYYLVYGNNIDEVIDGYRTLTGKAPIMPRWAMGFWQSRERYKSQEQILETAAQFRKRNIPIDNIVLDWFYWKENAWGSQEFDSLRFPAPESMLEELHNRYHTKLMISVWPKFYETTPGYKVFDRKGWMYRRNVADRQKDWVGPGYVSSFYDAFNPEARKAFWNLIYEKIYKKGIDAWWMDASEPDILSNVSPRTRKLQMTPLSAGLVAENLNAYPLQNAKGIYEGQRAADTSKRVFLLTRSGFAGSQRYAAAIWSGDIGARWDDMRAQIPAGINFSMSGLPYWTMDIGGFVVEKRFENPDEKDREEWRELMTRWYQFGAFVPLFRVHGQAPAREIFNVAPESHPAYQSMLYYNRLRYRLLPYVYSLAGMAYHRNYTLMRGLVMDFPEDRNVQSLGDQFMFGPSLLVSPVYTPGATHRPLYLPAGGWYDFYTGEYETGGRFVNAAAPYSRMPLYVKAGSVLPTGPALQYTDEKKPDTLLLQVFAGADGAFTLYEDEGTNYNYEKGSYATIAFEYDDRERQLTIGTRTGSFPGMLTERVFVIKYIRQGNGLSPDPAVVKGISVKYDGQARKISLAGNSKKNGNDK